APPLHTLFYSYLCGDHLLISMGKTLIPTMTSLIPTHTCATIASCSGKKRQIVGAFLPGQNLLKSPHFSFQIFNGLYSLRGVY
uniref:Uncharacterized protein n=1 Tax=Paramormyrops kingsleyae TaxID=1676925 RepID=A0A3B3TCD3_9TELE